MGNIYVLKEEIYVNKNDIMCVCGYVGVFMHYYTIHPPGMKLQEVVKKTSGKVSVMFLLF